MPSGAVKETVQARAGTRREYHIRRRRGETSTLLLWQFCKFRGTARGGRTRDAGRTAEIGARDNMQVIIERVKIDLDEDEIRRLIDAVEHYEAYLHSQQRDEMKFPRVARAASENAREAVVGRR